MMAYYWNNVMCDTLAELLALQNNKKIEKETLPKEDLCQKPVGHGTKYYPCDRVKGHKGVCT